MNTLFSPTDNSQPAADATDIALMCVQRACLIMLGTLMVLPAYAQVAKREPIAGNPTQGDGILPAAAPPTPPAPPRVAAPPPLPPPPPATPPPVDKPKTPSGEPGQGSGPTKTPIQGAGPATGTTNSTYSALPPVPPRGPDQPVQVAGPSAASRTAVVASTSAPVGTPPQGTQPQEVFFGGGAGNPPQSNNPTQGNTISVFSTLPASSPPTANGVRSFALPPNKTPSQNGSPANLTSDRRLSGGLAEILPGTDKLSESMQAQPSTLQAADTQAVATSTKLKCTPVSLRPDSQRPSMSLVDMTGDGLIVAAVAHEHIHAVFTRAGYGRIDLSHAARWCVTPGAARELLQPARSNAVQQAALLVQTSSGMQLMSQDQWVAHQASLQPLVAAMSPARSAKSSKLAKANGRLIAKPNVKSTGVTVGALRLPAGASKAGANS